MYQKQIGTARKPITIPSFSMPPGYTSVKGVFNCTVKVKRAKTTIWLGEDSMSMTMDIM